MSVIIMTSVVTIIVSLCVLCLILICRANAMADIRAKALREVVIEFPAEQRGNVKKTLLDALFVDETCFWQEVGRLRALMQQARQRVAFGDAVPSDGMLENEIMSR